MTVYYVNPDTKPGDTVHLGGTTCDRTPWRELTRPLVAIDATAYSDYSGSSVERSNHRVMLADEDMAPHLVRVIGSHGTAMLAYFPTDESMPDDAHSAPEPLRDAIAAMADYPILDDDDHSELETELETEAWAGHGREDFKRAFGAVLNPFDDDGQEHQIALPDDDAACPVADTIDSVAATWGDFWWDLWRKGCDEFNVNGGSGFTVETGGGVYFYVADWIDRALGMERTNPSEARRRIGIAFNRISAVCRLEAE